MSSKILLGSVCALSLISFSAAHASEIQQGFFVGLAATAAQPNYGLKVQNFAALNKKSPSTLYRGNIIVGYSELASSNNLYIGFEAGAQLGSSKAETIAEYNAGSPPVQNTVKPGAVIYADVMPGFVMGNQSSVFYGLIGVTDGRFTLAQINGDKSAQFNLSQNSIGFRIGLGYKYALTDNFAIGARYVFSDFGKSSFTNGTFQYSLEPKTNAFSFDVSYTFGGHSDTRGPFLED